jgi:acetyl/propionyl-CoA carboxylase alpha subunit
MKRMIRGAGWSAEIEWRERAETATYTLTLEGASPLQGAADIHEVEPGLYSVLLAGRSHEVKIVPGAAGWDLDVDGRFFSLDVVDPRENGKRHHLTLNPGRISLEAPMPGKVVRLLAAAGELVAAGQSVLVVEAMKMQNEIKSPALGRIVSLPAQPGDAVAANQTLAVVEVIPEEGE